MKIKNWQFWLGVLISALFIWLSLRGLHLDDFWQTVQKANYWWLLPGVAVYFVGVWARAWRWHYLLGPIKKIPTKTMFPVTTIGYMGNNIYPARAGEALRAVVGAGAFLGALAVFLLAAMFPQATVKIGTWIIERFLPQKMREKVSGMMRKFLEGLASLRSPFNVLMVFFTSVVIWLLETGKYWFVMHAFDFSVSFFALMLMNGVVNLATTIPSAPGYVGTFDAPGIAVLAAYGVEQATAAGYTLTLHVALWLPITLLGAYYMAREGLKWSDDLRKEIKE
ncbi:MAG: flippase-like domain-containing protein [Chloroflexi bacterium]|nr:flippase-like domain-containing protein [Chloroflexota bacterium]